MSEWQRVSVEWPPQGKTVETKIDDSKGARNEQRLKLRGCLWFTEDDAVYVYYSPTHWRHCASAAQNEG